MPIVHFWIVVREGFFERDAGGYHDAATFFPLNSVVMADFGDIDFLIPDNEEVGNGEFGLWLQWHPSPDDDLGELDGVITVSYMIEFDYLNMLLASADWSGCQVCD